MNENQIVKKKKSYKYDYPENRAIGRQCRGMLNFITTTMLKDKYKKRTVRAVMRGERNTPEIVKAMKHLLEISKTDNY